MKETNKLETIPLEDLIKKRKKLKGAIIGLGIVMVFACATLTYLCFKTKNYALLSVSIGCFLTMFPAIISFKNHNKEIASRKSK